MRTLHPRRACPLIQGLDVLRGSIEKLEKKLQKLQGLARQHDEEWSHEAVALWRRTQKAREDAAILQYALGARDVGIRDLSAPVLEKKTASCPKLSAERVTRLPMDRRRRTNPVSLHALYHQGTDAPGTGKLPVSALVQSLNTVQKKHPPHGHGWDSFLNT